MADSAKTRYPLVLVPGLLGFVRLPGYPYWYGIESALRREGAQVFPVLVSALHDSEVRGEQLLERIQAVLERTGADKVNLIGHSQGALTARYAAALRPQQVASVTSVAGPNHGSELADHLQRRAPPGSLREGLLVALMVGVAHCLAWLERDYQGLRLPLDARAAQRCLTRAGVAAFNARFPQGLPDTWGGMGPAQVQGVRYYSWTGTLQADASRGSNRMDLTHYACRLLARTFVEEARHCDGLVGRYSAHLGEVIGDDYPLDHLDIVNQGFGLVGRGADPVGLFLAHARRLREAGL
ncbi:triacylglycerol lipase [Pseudomonas sp. RIT-PI-AD]|uniref:esterase/lipase family protein n=1 Tax=Pseudomonas sp. RIT-PI-AD TaxID=3035294 RepID=UPI0021DAA2A4|nr:triacylglycerol lipase [Pseudomonas sp. RIT-PI-AD]